MFQRILALIIIVFFISRVFWQKRKKQIQVIVFVFWLVFWALAGILVLFLKQIDKFVSYLGFSASGIDILLYLGIAILFYFIFRLRLKLAKIEKDITVIVRNIALKDEK